MLDRPWWQRAVIYQIYPRSFQDSGDDGVGDLRGIIQRLPYLAELGIDAIWLSPIFTSPMADFGYDISDYEDIDPLFGTLADFDALLAATHEAGLKLILDLVPNHTSHQHPWFLQSRASRQNGRRDWYIWRDPSSDGGPPNNWLSEFGGSAWQYDDATGQYYYHAFLAAQPDLAWRNPAVRAAIYDVMRFWLRRGVDGFRVDVIWHLIKDAEFRDNPANPDYMPGESLYRSLVPLYSTDRPEVHEVIAEMRRVSDEFPDRALIGEIYLPLERLVAYYGHNLEGVHLPFNFSLIGAPWQAQSLRALIDEYEAALPVGGWPNWVLSNHDRPRIASRIGLDRARLAATLLMTLRGTPTIYYGDEIGMEQAQIPEDRIRDPFERNVPGLGLGRDGCRTPMQWDATAHAGFSRTDPWLPVHENLGCVNVACEQDDKGSIYRLYRRLIEIRRQSPAMMFGAYRPIAAPGDILLYLRDYEGELLLVALNFGDEPAQVTLPSKASEGRVALSTFADREEEQVGGSLHLRPKEGVIVTILGEAAQT
jgi:alpha-glucosidase